MKTLEDAVQFFLDELLYMHVISATIVGESQFNFSVAGDDGIFCQAMLRTFRFVYGRNKFDAAVAKPFKQQYAHLLTTSE